MDAGVVVGLKEQTAMLVQGSSVDKPEGKKGNSCSLNSPLNTSCTATYTRDMLHSPDHLTNVPSLLSVAHRRHFIIGNNIEGSKNKVILHLIINMIMHILNKNIKC